MERAPLHRSLYVRVLAAIALGALVGYVRPHWGEHLKPLGDGFIKLIKMLIAPIVFSTLVVGIAGAGDMKKVGRIGLKALAYFEAVTSVALAIGLVVANVLRPGEGVHAEAAAAAVAGAAVAGAAGAPPPHPPGVVDFVLGAIPENVVGAFAEGAILQVLVFSVLFGAALAAMGSRGRPLVELIDRLAHALFGVVALVMKLAPLGAFGAMAYTVGRYGLRALGNLGELMGGFYLTAALFVLLVLGAIARLAGVSIVRLIRYLREEILVVLGTSSSESVLPRMLEKMEALGCDRAVVGLVIPTGYSFNLDGTSIYLTMAALFVAQATGVQLSLGEQLKLVGVMLLTSKGAAATLASTGKIPVAGLALLLGVDRFMSEARAITNLIGNAVATIVVARWERAFDPELAKQVLDGASAGASV